MCKLFSVLQTRFVVPVPGIQGYKANDKFGKSCAEIPGAFFYEFYDAWGVMWAVGQYFLGTINLFVSGRGFARWWPFLRELIGNG